MFFVIPFVSGRKNLFAALLLFAAVFLVYTIPVSDWRFWWDDYAYTEKLDGLGHVQELFTTKPHNIVWLPANQQKTFKLTFFNVMYRPLASLWLALEMRVLGNQNPWLTYLITTGLYAACVVMFFYLLSLFLPLCGAFFGAMLFAFHPCMGNWMGQFCAQPLHLGFLVLGSIILLLRKPGRLRVFFASVLAFVLFFLHEWFLVIPVWLFMSFVYCAHGTIFERFRKGFLRSLSFFLVLAAYFFARVATYHLENQSLGIASLPYKLFCLLKGKLFDFQFAAMAIDLLGIGCVPHGYRVAKLALILGALCISLLLFFNSKRKGTILFLFVSSVLFYWMSFLVPHCDRYVYIPIAFFIAAMLVASIDAVWSRRSVYVSFVALSFVGAFHNVHALRRRSLKRVAADNALRSFVRATKPFKNPILFVGIPFDWFPLGLAQGVQLHNQGSPVLVFYDVMLTVFCWDFAQRKTAWKLPRQQVVSVEWDGELGLRMRSQDHSLAWFYDQPREQFSLGNRSVLGRWIAEMGPQAYDVKFEIGDEFVRGGLDLVTWDFERQKFRILGTMERKVN